MTFEKDTAEIHEKSTSLSPSSLGIDSTKPYLQLYWTMLMSATGSLRRSLGIFRTAARNRRIFTHGNYC